MNRARKRSLPGRVDPFPRVLSLEYTRTRGSRPSASFASFLLSFLLSLPLSLLSRLFAALFSMIAHSLTELSDRSFAPSSW